MMIAFIIVMAFLGAPLFAAFGCLALQAYASVDLDASVITSELSRLATMPLLQTLPMFALAGYVLAHSKASDRLVRVSRALFGWMPGGLAIVCLVACTLFTAFTGATGVTIVALGGLLLPALLSERYKERFALGLVTNGGNVGVLFVPSLPLILYGVIANPIAREVTIDRLFLAGILPGLLSVGALAVFSAAYGLGAHVPRTKFSLREVGAALWAARWEVPLAFVVIGGFYAGKLVVCEAAVISAANASRMIFVFSASTPACPATSSPNTRTFISRARRLQANRLHSTTPPAHPTSRVSNTCRSPRNHQRIACNPSAEDWETRNISILPQRELHTTPARINVWGAVRRPTRAS